MSLALIAGRGGLPARVAAAQAEPPLVCAYEGCAPDGLKPDLTFRLETLGSLLAHLLGVGIRDVCLCGAIDRPTLDPAKLDIRTAPLVPQFKQALAAGDNGALEVIKTIFEDHGLRVVGADELVPDLIADSGVLSRELPDEQMRRDAARGAAVLDGLATLDIGQACVIGREQVYGVETIGGTDHLLATL
ncbi:MAG: UDP-2,3-diacylglucosamine diphosphatase LpxI, partial [Sulfitobacter sp.]